MIRTLQTIDLPNIRDINDLSLGYNVPLALTEKQFHLLNERPDHLLFGYVDDKSNQLVGYIHAQVYQSLYSEAGLNILALAVLPHFQGRGIGKELIRELENKAKMRGYDFIRLNSASYRHEAHAFYQKMEYNSDKMQLRFLKEL